MATLVAELDGEIFDPRFNAPQFLIGAESGSAFRCSAIVSRPVRVTGLVLPDGCDSADADVLTRLPSSRCGSGTRRRNGLYVPDVIRGIADDRA
jgi:hypothetical protein